MDAPSTLERMQARGRIYGFLASALRFPDPPFAQSLADAAFWHRLEGAAATLRDFDCAQALNLARQFGFGVGTEQLQDQHYDAFGHTLRGEVPPYEIEYGSKDVFQMSEQLTDIGAFYSAFGMQVDPNAHERLDHIAAELEFMFLLCAHQMAAAEEHDAKGVQHMAVARDAQRTFMRDHLSRWGIAFGRRLQVQSGSSFLGAVGKVLEAFLLLECKHLALPPGPRFLDLRAIGTAEELVAEQACATTVPVPGGDAVNECEADD